MEPYVFRTNFLYRVPSPQFHHSHGLRFMKLTLKSAPTAHRVRETVDRLSRDIPDYISPLRWPPNSPDLNPVEYAIWGKLQERVYRTPIVTSITSLSDSWRSGPDLTTRSSVLQCVWGQTDFEHFLRPLMNDHTASLEKTERVFRVVTETCVFDM